MFSSSSSSSVKPPSSTIIKSESDLLWVDKYKPKSISEIIGCADTVKKLHDWLTKWHLLHLTKDAKIPFGGKENTGAKAVLLSGPPGIGKTTMARLVAETCGYEVMEMNASDTRNKASLDTELMEASLSSSINISDVTRVNSKKRVIVMDEVDGMGGSDRGGMAELLKIIKTSKCPIICVCNDRQSQKVRSLANNCYDLKVRRPMKNQIAARLVQIAKQEGLTMEVSAAELLAEQVGNDIRQVINACQMWKAMNNTMKTDELKENMNKIEKDKVLRQSPFEACLSILGGQHLSFSERYDSFFIDYSLVPLLIQENYIDAAKGSNAMRQCSDVVRLEKLSAAADAVSDFDIVGPGKMGQDMHWDLLPVQAAFCIKVGSILQGFLAFPSFPKWLGKYSTTSKSKRLTREIVSHTQENIGQGFESMRLTYIPYMSRLILHPLLVLGSDGVPMVLEMLQHYGLTKDDVMESFKELSFFWPDDKVLKNEFDEIESKVKSALTRQYNELQPTSQALCYALGVAKGKAKGRTSISPDDEGLGGLLDDEETPAVEEVKEEEVDLSAFQKKAKKGKSASTGAKRSGDAVAPASSKKQKK